ncbi:hypothetical protein HMPREF0262_00758 [Clostridium sp. ATCC 29733]|nr:hypothetical protein HMPREF0262_00758 [Clostridium sp. ATCC 29733]
MDAPVHTGHYYRHLAAKSQFARLSIPPSRLPSRAAVRQGGADLL